MRNSIGDAVLSLPASTAAGATGAVMGRAQNLVPAEAITGLSVSLLLICDEAGVSVTDALTAAGRQLRDAESTTKGNNQLGGVRDLLRNELAL